MWEEFHSSIFSTQSFKIQSHQSQEVDHLKPVLHG